MEDDHINGQKLGAGAAVLLIPLLVWLYWVTTWAPGPRDVVALDHALVARELVAGRGMSSPVVTPLHVRLERDLDKADPIFAKPALALWQAFWFLFTDPSDDTVVLISGVFFVLAAWLVFILASRFHSRETAWICFLVFVLNPYVLDVSTSGRPEAMGMFLVCLLFLVLSRERSDLDDDIPLTACFRSGLIAGILMLCVLYLSLPLLVLLPLYWCRWAWREREGDAIGWFDRRLCLVMAGLFVLGALVPGTLVYLGRVFVPGEAPVPVGRFLIAMNTSVSMGWSFWREYAASTPYALDFFAQFTPSVMLKWLAGLSYGFSSTFAVFQPVVGALFILALFFPEHGESHGYRWLLLALVSLHIAAMALFYWDSRVLSVWSPMIIITGVGTFSEFLQRRFLQLQAEEAGNRPRAFWRRRELRLYYLPMTLILALTTGTMLLRMSERLPPARPAPSAAMEIMREEPDRYTYIVTPAPWLVAWHTGARTFWMPEMEYHMRQLEQRFGDRLPTVYLPRNRAEILHDYLPSWWYLALRERNKLPGYEMANFSGYGEAVYVRKPVSGVDP